MGSGKENMMAKHPTIAAGIDGDILRAYWVEKVIYGQIRHSGDLQYSAPFAFTDETGNAIQFKNAQFHVQQGFEGPSRWLLTAIEDGATEPSEWWSGELEPRTWTRIS